MGMDNTRKSGTWDGVRITIFHVPETLLFHVKSGTWDVRDKET